jgi:hypothetical protein
VNQECQVLFLSQHLIKKTGTSATLLTENISLAQAGVNEQTKGEGKIGFMPKVANGLRAAIFFQDKIFFVELADNLSLLIANGSKQVNHLDLHRQGGLLIAPQRIPRQKNGNH